MVNLFVVKSIWRLKRTKLKWKESEDGPYTRWSDKSTIPATVAKVLPVHDPKKQQQLLLLNYFANTEAVHQLLRTTQKKFHLFEEEEEEEGWGGAFICWKVIEGEEKPFEEILRHDEGDGEDKNIKLDIKFSSNDGEREREKRADGTLGQNIKNEMRKLRRKNSLECLCVKIGVGRSTPTMRIRERERDILSTFHLLPVVYVIKIYYLYKI